MSKVEILSEFFSFLKNNKKWWLIPIVLFFLVFGALLVFSQSSALAPFIYALF